jgi:hypothetical protein
MAPLAGWKARADAISAKVGEAGMPNNWFADDVGGQCPHVKVERAEGSVVLKVFPTGTPDVTTAIVTPGVLGIAEGKEENVELTPMTIGAYRRNWLLHTWPGRLTVIGLVLVAMGQLINISLEIGEEWVAIDVGADGVAAAKASIGVLTLIGAVLAAWQGLLKS